MIGIPPIAGFISKWTLGLGALEVGQDWVLLVLLGSALLNAAYFLPLLWRGWFAETGRLARGPLGRRALRDPLDAAATALLTALLSLLVGLLARGAQPAGMEPVDRRAGVRHMSAWLWLLVPFAPLLGAALLPWLRERALPWLWLSGLPALLAALQPPVALELPWLWEVRWGADDVLTRAWLGVFRRALDLRGDLRQQQPGQRAGRLRFWMFWQLAVAGNLLIIATDALSFYLGFSAMSLSAYGLIVHRGGPGPRRAGRLYLQLAICGEMLLLAGLLLRTQAADQASSPAGRRNRSII